MMSKTKGFRIALLQLSGGTNKARNIANALSKIRSAVQEHAAQVVVLPECFNSPYGNDHFAVYAEEIPGGETSVQLSAIAKELGIYLVGGSIPEKVRGSDKLYNSCTVWAPNGDLIDTYRKIHMFDLSVKGGITFKESATLTGGSKIVTFDVYNCRIGVGICHDMRFDELARIYRNKGCNVLIYPGAFSVKTGELHWELLARSRANDCQAFVASCSPASDEKGGYVAWGHSLVVNPWGQVLQKIGTAEGMLIQDIDCSISDDVRAQIPVFSQRRTDLYDCVDRTSQ